jgi:hypothetical protein
VRPVEGYPAKEGEPGYALGCSEVLPGRKRKSGTVVGYDRVGRSPIG